jgi:alkanesulfonate monooxygenase SsuD/methylene tetrahydromethanopterin reductase-like flavin-dependent oxidoreductase (luciferase family)
MAAGVEVNRMRIGVAILPETRWSEAATWWRHAEELGFDHAWTYDHLAWRNLRDDPWFAAVPTLAAAATVTTTIRLGTLVASPNFRHPVPFARDVLALEDIAGGRLTIGIGAGGTGWDATILGQEPWPMAERTARFEEFVGLLDRLLREPAVSATGRYYSADGARSVPGSLQQPRVPFAIAATGPKGFRVAAEHGQAWVTYGRPGHVGPPLEPVAGAEQVRRQIAQLEEACAAVGRDPATIDRLVLTGSELAAGMSSRAEFEDTKGVYAAAGVTDLVIHRPRRGEPYAGDPALLDQLMS